MIIEDIFSGENERFYSVLLTSEEMKMFSSIEDENYVEGRKKLKKLLKYGAPTVGATLGVGLGGVVGGHILRSPKLGSAVGGLVGGITGHRIGKKERQKQDDKIEKYLLSSEEDKKILRDIKDRNNFNRWLT